MKEKKKYSYDVREIDAWSDLESGWTWNASFHIGTMETAAEDVRRREAWYKKAEEMFPDYWKRNLLERIRELNPQVDAEIGYRV